MEVGKAGVRDRINLSENSKGTQKAWTGRGIGLSRRATPCLLAKSMEDPDADGPCSPRDDGWRTQSECKHPTILVKSVDTTRRLWHLRWLSLPRETVAAPNLEHTEKVRYL